MNTTIFLLLWLLIFQDAFSQPKTFREFIIYLNNHPDSITKAELITNYLSGKTLPLTDEDSLHFIYRGKGNDVAVPGEMNRWIPNEAKMTRVRGTDFFYRSYQLPPTARVEYKLLIDYTWILDPLNPKTTTGGFGKNSEVWMPKYNPSEHNGFNQESSRGRIDTLWFESKLLRHSHPVFIYTPVGYKAGNEYPEIFITDGGEYLSLAGMHIILDNLIASKKIQPVIGIFIDPRTIPTNSATTHRMTEYSANDTFMNFLQYEVAPLIEQRYAFTSQANKRLIMGASMGGVISTYAVLQYPQFVLNCAAQSPAYLQAESIVIKLAEQAKSSRINVWIDTGTINDTQAEAQRVKTLLEKQNIRVRYTEVPEGHNWTNWKNRIPGILTYFFPGK